MKPKIGILFLLLLFPISVLADDKLAIQAYNAAQQALNNGNDTEADKQAQQALKNAGPTQTDLIVFSNEILARVESHQKHYVEAAALYERIVSLAETQHLPEEKICIYKRNLASAYINSQQPQKAMPLLKEWITFQEKKPTPDTLEIGKSTITLGQVEYELQHYGDAKIQFTKGLALVEPRLPGTDRWIVSSKDYLARLANRDIKVSYENGLSAFSQGDKTEALKNWQSALKQLQSNNPRDPRITDLRQKISQAQKIEEDTETYLQDLSPDIRRWDKPEKTVVVFIQNNNTVPGWTSETLTPIIQKALAQWQEAVNNQVRFDYTDNPKHYDVKISWTATTPDSHPEKRLLGRNVFYTQGNYLTQNDIELQIPLEQQGDKTRTEIYTTILHEAGHMMGIVGHSPNPSDVMYSDSTYQLPMTLSKRDLSTIQAIYKLKPKYTNPQNTLVSEYRPNQQQAISPLVTW